jgi:hypothetical protein
MVRLHVAWGDVKIRHNPNLKPVAKFPSCHLWWKDKLNLKLKNHLQVLECLKLCTWFEASQEVQWQQSSRNFWVRPVMSLVHQPRKFPKLWYDQLEIKMMRFFATLKNLLEKKEKKIGRLFSFACLIFLESK